MIDLCIGFNGGNSDVLSRMFFGLLQRHCNLLDVQVHVIDNGVPPGVEIIGFPPYTIQHKIRKDWVSTRDKYHTDSAICQYEMCRWIIDNCGICEWCVLCDFDMIIRKDIFAEIKKGMTWDVGIIGSHGTNHNQLTPLFAINRVAWIHRRVGFEAGTRKDGTRGDLGILLAEDLEDLGYKWWKFEAEPGMEEYYHHMGGGGGYHSKQEFEAMRERALKICEEEGIL